MFPNFFKLFRPTTAKDLDVTTVESRFERARSLNHRGQFEEAATVCLEVLDLHPDHIESLTLLAEIEAKLGHLEQAVELYTRFVNLRPDHAPAYYKRANLLKDGKRWEAALASYDQAVALDPGYANAYCNRGAVLEVLNRPDEALASYDRAVALNPGDALAFYNRAGVLRDLNRMRDAIASYGKAVAIRPDYVEAYCNRGAVLQELKEWDAALASYDRAIEIDSRVSAAYLNRGNLLRERRRLNEALTSYSRAIEIDPNNAKAHANRGVLFTDLRQWDAAFADFNQAVELDPDLAEAYCYRAKLSMHVLRVEAAIVDFDRAVGLRPEYAEAFSNRADALVCLKQYPAAIASYDRAFSLAPDFRYLLGMRRHVKMQICDWGDLESDVERLSAGIEAGMAVSTCFPILALLDSAPLHLKVAQIWVREEHPAAHSLPVVARYRAPDKIRLGYFSADFHEHPVALLAIGFLEAHDRSKFEVTAFSCGPDTQDAIRKRIELTVDRFIDVSAKSDQEVALLARNLGIDIAVDLGGYTGNSRTRLFALRVAPMQIGFLGYPGTTGAEYMDYLVGDRMVIPEAQRQHYAEKIVYLPNSFLPYDSSREIANTVFSREDLGLPHADFIFCCFNNSYKITPDTFDSWMRILKRVENSVLWLSLKDPLAASNLRGEAIRRGVDAGRLIFADRVASLPEHLARQRAAGLFLDTLPYNAHATALDALWAGLPVLTCIGETFAGRVAASLLNAIEVPELIAATPTQYENLAVQLATSPRHLEQIRQKLARNRLKTPLFDTKAFTSHLEAAYTKVHERYQASLPPDHIFVEP